MKAPELILLAAGNSTRFGGNKLLYPVEGVPMYLRALTLLEELTQRVPDSCILTVTQYPEIETTCRERGITCVRNPHPEEGITSSIRLALEAGKEERPCVFFTADQPWLRADTVEKLILGWRTSGKGLAALSFQGEPGNPCCFSPEYREAMVQLTGDKGGKRILKAHPEDVFLYEVQDPKELEDIDFRAGSRRQEAGGS